MWGAGALTSSPWVPEIVAALAPGLVPAIKKAMIKSALKTPPWNKKGTIADGTKLAEAKGLAKDLTAQGYKDFSFQSDPRATQHYPSTYNWQKGLGGHYHWSTSEVHVENGMATMKIVIEAEDMWNFDKGKQDAETGISDAVNGRFQELGWAREFKTHGKIERTYTWSVEDAAQISMPGKVEPSEPNRSEDGVLAGRSSGGIREDRNEPEGGGPKANWELREPVNKTPWSRGQGKRE